MKISVNDIIIFLGISIFIYCCWCIHPLAGMFTISFVLLIIGYLGTRKEDK